MLSDADFHCLDVSKGICIRVTLGELPDILMDIEIGIPIRGYDSAGGSIHPEASGELEHVVTVQLSISSDLEPRWCFCDDNTPLEGGGREVRWSHREMLLALRLGTSPAPHLSWGQRSVLNRISKSKPDTGTVLAAAARQARQTFAEGVTDQFETATSAVVEVAQALGVRGALHVNAALSAHSVSVRDGAIALHDRGGVSLANLGVGSARLLAAGLQAKAAKESAVTLIDELEHGLEPYRIARLLHHLGAKQDPPPQQVVLTTHSPFVLRELDPKQIWVVRRGPDGHTALHQASSVQDGQLVLRHSAEALLSPKVLVCEGPTEQGLMQGLDLFRIEQGEPSMAVMGVTTSNGEGNNMFRRALAFAGLGYRVALFRDCDKSAPAEEAAFLSAGGQVFHWEQDNCTEQQLIQDLPDASKIELLRLAIRLKGQDAVRQGLYNQTKVTVDLAAACTAFPPELVGPFGVAAKKGNWFKSLNDAELVGRHIVGPILDRCGWTLWETISNLFGWMEVEQGEPDADG